VSVCECVCVCEGGGGMCVSAALVTPPPLPLPALNPLLFKKHMHSYCFVATQCLRIFIFIVRKPISPILTPPPRQCQCLCHPMAFSMPTPPKLFWATKHLPGIFILISCKIYKDACVFLKGVKLASCASTTHRV